MAAPKRAAFLRLLPLILLAGISVIIYLMRGQAARLTAYGYPGIFLIAFLTNATVIVPVPGMAFVFAATSVLSPWGVMLAAASGAALGELSGYLGGLSGQGIVEDTRMYQRIAPYIRRYGAWGIFTLAAIPNPFFDLAGIAAGISRMPLGRFLLSCWLGQMVKMGLTAHLGSLSWHWLLH